MKHKYHYHLFTLIELLIVVAIIGILMSILLPALSKARQTALRISCASNQRQVGIAITSYAGDNDGFPPYFPKNLKWGPYYPIDTSGYLDVPGSVRVPVGLGLLAYHKYLPLDANAPNNGVNQWVGVGQYCPTLFSKTPAYAGKTQYWSYAYGAVAKSGYVICNLKYPIKLYKYPYDKSGKGRSAFVVMAACPRGVKYGTL